MCNTIKDRIAQQEKIKQNQELIIKRQLEDKIARQIKEADEEL